MNESDFNAEVKKLLHECNSMQCPDCGGIHHVSFKALPDGSVSVPEFKEDLFGAPCFGYKRFIIDSINTLKRRYNKDVRP